MTQEIPSPNPSHPEKEKSSTPINQEVQKVRKEAQDALSPRERKLQELRERRESGEVDPYDMDLNYLFQLQQNGMALTASDVGKQAVVLTSEDLQQLGALDITLRSGDITKIDVECPLEDDVLILYPEDLGN